LALAITPAPRVKVFTYLEGRGVARTKKIKQTPFGEVLQSARVRRAWSRAKVAEETGIGQNSIVRYEKAGIEPDGQYPPASKIGSICFALGIPPEDALYACLSQSDFEKYATEAQSEDAYGYPLFRAMAEEGVSMAQENVKLRTMVRMFLLAMDGEVEMTDEAANWIREEFHKFGYEIQKDENDIFYALEDTDEEELEQLVKRNGPDQKGPSRSKTHTTDEKAVGAASTKPKKDRIDEAD
jgi:transcriptional regulator with XRE-family HTH domain